MLGTLFKCVSLVLEALIKTVDSVKVDFPCGYIFSYEQSKVRSSTKYFQLFANDDLYTQMLVKLLVS